MKRKLYRDLGYASINRYAREALGFSKTRTGDYVQLARKLGHLPAVRASVARGDLGYTKAREVVKVADSKNEKAWVEEARKSSRRVLEVKVARAKRVAATADQPTLMPEPTLPKASPPVRVTLDMTPDQFALFEKLMESLAKKGRRGGQTEVVLEALGFLCDDTEKAPRGARRAGAPFQVLVHECPSCQTAMVATGKGDLNVDKATRGRARCDGRIARPGQRNKATIPPAVRRLVLARDRQRCRTPGCDHTRFLEVHHITPRAKGGRNDPDNLVTLCSACHRLWHEKPGGMAALAGG